MNADSNQGSRIVWRLPPLERMVRFGDWMGRNKTPFITEALEVLRQGMDEICEYLQTHHPRARAQLTPDVIVTENSLFNAYLDTRRRILINPDTGTRTEGLPEISINIGVPITLACLKPVLSFAAREVLSRRETPIPTDLLVMVIRLYEAWHHDTYPPAFVTSLHEDPSFDATLIFLLAHETSHHVFAVEREVAAEYRSRAHDVLNQLLKEPEFFTAPQIAYTKDLLSDPDLYDGWIDELAADAMAYNICRSVCEQKGRRDLMGITTLCAMGAIIERHFELEDIQFKPSHPYSAARLMAFEKHQQNLLGLSTAEFKQSFEWLLPTLYFDSTIRILQSIGDIHWGDFTSEESASANTTVDDSQAIRNEKSADDLNALEWVQIGKAFDRDEDWQKAIICYDRALQLEPDFASAWSHKGNSLLQTKKRHQALECFDSALKLDETLARAWVGRGDTLAALGRIDEAIESYERFLRHASPGELHVGADGVRQEIFKLKQLRKLFNEADKFGIEVLVDEFETPGKRDYKTASLLNFLKRWFRKRSKVKP